MKKLFSTVCILALLFGSFSCRPKYMQCSKKRYCKTDIKKSMPNQENITHKVRHSK